MLSGARLVVVESSLSRRRDFEITAWVAAALPAAAASWRYVRNLWINEPQFRKMNLHLWHQGDTFQQKLFQKTKEAFQTLKVSFQRLSNWTCL